MVNSKDVLYKILRDNIIIDGHLDLTFDIVRKRQQGKCKVIETDYLQEFIDGGVNIVVSSIYIDNLYIPEMALRRALDHISALYEDVGESSDKLMICKSYSDIEEAYKSGKIGILLSFEGVEPLINDIYLLRIFYELGVRGVGLCWNRRNYAAEGVSYTYKDKKGNGLSDFGISLIREAEKLGMFIDVSHLNDEGFWDVMKYATKPVIASHSNSRTICNIMRNLTDKQIKAIASKKGIIGMNGVSIIVSNDDAQATIDTIIKHVDHISHLVGTKYIGIGLDLCTRLWSYGNNTIKIDEKHRISFDILKNHTEIPIIIDSLLKKGYVEEDVVNIMGNNFMRVFKEVLTK